MAKIWKKPISLLLVLAVLCTTALAAERSLVPIGHTTGIKIFCDGVMVVRTVPINSESGTKSPAQHAGVREGDVILKINETQVNEIETLQKLIASNHGTPVDLLLRRDGTEHSVTVTPVRDDQGAWQIGLWVRDSMAGIGTITFYDPNTGEFGALGHGICDTETNLLVPMKAGSVMESSVKQVRKGSAGTPGELVGEYDLKEDSGVLYSNTEQGIFGVLSKKLDCLNRTAIPIAEKEEIKLGSATILSNIQGNDVREYQIEITQIYQNEEENGKSMMIRVTDPALIAKTGGIVQGMSGSPILQNGRIVGAVTHVLVNDPTKGYGIFIENMLDAAG